MTRDDIVLELAVARRGFDDRVAAVPMEALAERIPGFAHTVAGIVYHVSAYDKLIVERLIAARHGARTALMRDHEGWEAFNVTTWAEGAGADPARILKVARDTFTALSHEVGSLSDEELNAAIGSTASLDPAWLQGRPPWRAIAVDSYEHYPAHFPALDAAISGFERGE